MTGIVNPGSVWMSRSLQAGNVPELYGEPVGQTTVQSSPARLNVTMVAANLVPFGQMPQAIAGRVR
jgi:hypothetical protein